MTTAATKTDKAQTGPATPGDNRSVEDLDGNKAGAKTQNKAPGPDEPELPTGSDKPPTARR